MEDSKILLNVEETAAYLNIGKTKTRELMKENDKIFVVRIGNRNYAHKALLDKWLLAQIKNREMSRVRIRISHLCFIYGRMLFSWGSQ